MSEITILYSGKIITREQARKNGLTVYFTGKPCKHGHICERFAINGNCKECSRKKASKRYYKNPQKYNESSKKWAQQNREKRKEIIRRYSQNHPEISKRWVENNREKVREYKRRWKLKNKEAINSHTRNRRAKIRESVGTHTQDDILYMLNAQKHKCINCLCSLKKNKYHVDHIVPIVRGGSNDRSNLQILCQSCNVRKSSKDYRAWCKENGRLL